MSELEGYMKVSKYNENEGEFNVLGMTGCYQNYIMKMIKCDLPLTDSVVER